MPAELRGPLGRHELDDCQGVERVWGAVDGRRKERRVGESGGEWGGLYDRSFRRRGDGE